MFFKNLKNYYFIYFFLKTSKTNFYYEGILSNIRFNLNPEKIEVIIFYKTEENFDIFKTHDIDTHHDIDTDSIRSLTSVGLLFDIITTCSEIIISNNYKGYFFEQINNLDKQFYDLEIKFKDFLKNFQTMKSLYQIGTSDNEWPVIIQKNTETKFDDKNISRMQYLIENLCHSNKLNNVAISLLNYWKKGFILSEITFKEESFLNFYKILEYFLGKNTPDEKITDIIDKFSIGDKEIAKRLITTIIDIRNNWDIAHKSIKRKSGDKGIISRDELFNLSYIDYLWSYHDDLKEISKFFIFKYLDIKNIKFIIDKNNSLATEVIV